MECKGCGEQLYVVEQKRGLCGSCFHRTPRIVATIVIQTIPAQGLEVMLHSQDKGMWLNKATFLQQVRLP